MMTEDDLASAIRALRTEPAGVADVLALFLRWPLHCPTGPDGQHLPATLGKFGSWLFVFTSEHLLDAYRDATGARWSGSSVWLGQDLACLAHGLSTGVLVNASPQRGVGAEAALPLPPQTIADLIGTGARYKICIRRAGETTVHRMTDSGGVTDGEMFAASYPDEQEAQRAANRLREQLDKQHPGSAVWIAPL